MFRGIAKTLLLSTVALMPLCAQASEDIDKTATYTGQTRVEAVDIDEYMRAGKKATLTFNQDTDHFGDNEPVVLELECVGDSLDRYGEKTSNGEDFMGGWRILSQTGTCYGREFQKEEDYNLEYTARSECNEVTELTPDEKDYCVWEGTKSGRYQITGDTGDDMFQILPAGDNVNGFLEYRLAAPEIHSKYRVRWIERNDGTNSDKPLMIPSGPSTTFSDYKGFVDRYEDKSSGPVTVNKACLPIEISVCLNHPPVTVDDSFTMKEETTLTANLLSNDFDPDDGNPDPDPITLSRLVTQPKNGQISTQPNGTITYTPKNNWFGVETFQYEAVDSKGSKTIGNVKITVTNL